MNKLGVKGIKTWKKRWFKQENSNLFYYKSKEKQDEQPLGVIELFGFILTILLFTLSTPPKINLTN